MGIAPRLATVLLAALACLQLHSALAEEPLRAGVRLATPGGNAPSRAGWEDIIEQNDAGREALYAYSEALKNERQTQQAARARAVPGSGPLPPASLNHEHDEVRHRRRRAVFGFFKSFFVYSYRAIRYILVGLVKFPATYAFRAVVAILHFILVKPVLAFYHLVEPYAELALFASFAIAAGAALSTVMLFGSSFVASTVAEPVQYAPAPPPPARRRSKLAPASAPAMEAVDYSFKSTTASYVSQSQKGKGKARRQSFDRPPSYRTYGSNQTVLQNLLVGSDEEPMQSDDEEDVDIDSISVRGIAI